MTLLFMCFLRAPTLLPALCCLAQLAVRRLLAELDAPVHRIVDVGEDATRECTRRTRLTHRQPALPEGGNGALDVLSLETPMIQAGETRVLRLRHLEERVPADLEVR